MPLEPATPAYKAALDGFIADVEKLMREKLVGLGDYHNLGDIEGEIDRLGLRIQLLGTDPEFQESVKKLDAKRIDLARKRDQIKPFLLKLERELAIYRAAQQGGGEPELTLGQPVEEEPTVPMQPVPAAPPPVAAAPVRAPQPAPVFAPAPAPMPPAFPPVAPPQPAPFRPPMPQPAPRTATPPPAAAPIAAQQLTVEEAVLDSPPELDMSLPPEEPMDDVNFLAAPSDFLQDAALTNQGGGFAASGPELTLDTVPSAVAAPPAPAAPPSAGAQWPPPGQAMPDPFASFQGQGRPAAPPPQPAARPAPAPAAAQPPRPATPAPAPGAPRPAAPPAAGAAAAKPGVKPPWVK